VIDMNLIEQLGGYDRAKHEFEMIKEMKPIHTGEIEANDRLLLEYRRQHNIFEVGDKVVYRKQCNLIWDGVYDVDAVLADGQVIERDLPTPKEWLSHATDEEIKAGKRRPELDSDTCSDIRNHVTPLTKVIDR